MNKKYDIDTIISVEEFEKNRQEHLKRNAKRKKQQKKEELISSIVVGILLFALATMVTIMDIQDANMQKKCANEPRIQIAQNQ